ncbi:methyltransferase [Nocardia concava]|uniref:methyltransferase n=1 Tax=Nocardia concava TaxID=257281 RepID=UPI0002DE4415|nr:methyltransferase [Nocardia concava]
MSQVSTPLIPAPGDPVAPSDTGGSPAHILGVVSGARRAQVVLAAAELDLFTVLADRDLAAAEIGAAIGLHPEWTRDFLDAVASSGLIIADGGRYSNSPDAHRYLVRGRPEYLGGFLRFLDKTLHPAWTGLAASVKSGKPVNSDAAEGDPYGVLFTDPDDRRGFFDAMDVLNAPIGAALARLDWSQRGTFADIGGARGNIAASLVRAHPHLRATVFDLPEVESEFDSHIGELGLKDRIEFRPGDFFTDPLPSAEVLIFGHVLHNWPVARRRQLIEAAYAALPDGGTIAIYDPVIDPARPSPSALLASLNMLVWSSGGSEYTVAEAETWLRDAGFVDIAAAPLGPTSTLITGERPRHGRSTAEIAR